MRAPNDGATAGHAGERDRTRCGGHRAKVDKSGRCARADLPARLPRQPPHLAPPDRALVGPVPLHRPRPARLSRLVQAARGRELYPRQIDRRRVPAGRCAGDRKVHDHRPRLGRRAGLGGGDYGADERAGDPRGDRQCAASGAVSRAALHQPGSARGEPVLPDLSRSRQRCAGRTVRAGRRAAQSIRSAARKCADGARRTRRATR